MGFIYEYVFVDSDVLSPFIAHVYIGQTKKTFKLRKQGSYTNCTCEGFFSGYKRYEVVLEQCDDSLLNERESFWINYFKGLSKVLPCVNTVNKQGVYKSVGFILSVIDGLRAGLSNKELVSKLGINTGVVTRVNNGYRGYRLDGVVYPIRSYNKEFNNLSDGVKYGIVNFLKYNKVCGLKDCRERFNVSSDVVALVKKYNVDLFNCGFGNGFYF
jgi:hypothetical protein